MKEIVIFGAGQTAEIVHCCFSRSNEYKIVAFTVHSKFFIEDKLLGLPIIPFEDLEKKYPEQVFYYPSFEMVLAYNPNSFVFDNRHVMRKTVKRIFKALDKGLLKIPLF